MLKHSVVTALNFRFDLTNAIELFSVSAWFTSTEIKQTALALSRNVPKTYTYLVRSGKRLETDLEGREGVSEFVFVLAKFLWLP